MRRQFRTYLLLEVLIALTLVATCTIPIMRVHGTLARRQMEKLRDMQLEWHAQEKFSKVRKKLYQGDIGWNNLNEGDERQKNHTEDLKSVKIQFPSGTQEYACSATVMCADKHKKGKRAKYRFLAINITFTPPTKPQEPITYIYHQFVERCVEGERQE